MERGSESIHDIEQRFVGEQNETTLRRVSGISGMTSSSSLEIYPAESASYRKIRQKRRLTHRLNCGFFRKWAGYRRLGWKRN